MIQSRIASMLNGGHMGWNTERYLATPARDGTLMLHYRTGAVLSLTLEGNNYPALVFSHYRTEDMSTLVPKETEVYQGYCDIVKDNPHYAGLVYVYTDHKTYVVAETRFEETLYEVRFSLCTATNMERRTAGLYGLSYRVLSGLFRHLDCAEMADKRLHLFLQAAHVARSSFAAQGIQLEALVLFH